MLALALAVLLLVGGNMSREVGFTVRCSERNESSVDVEGTPTAARYVVTYCALSRPAPLSWELLLSSVNEPAENCSYQQLGEARAGVRHSHSVEAIDPSLNLTCRYVCFSKPMDLMFRSCYRLENKIVRRGPRQPINSEPYNIYYYADNNVTKYTNDNLQYFKCTDYDDMVVCNWYEGLVPITEYEVFMWPNSTHYTEEPTSVSANCSHAESSVRCALHVAPGCYVLQLRHTAPWTAGLNRLAVHNALWCYSAGAPPQLEAPTDAGLYWVLGGLLLLGALLLGALLASHRRLRAKARLRTVSHWLHRRGVAEVGAAGPGAGADGGGGDGGGGGEGGGGGGGGPVLLLYARDCARLAAALRDWMQAVAPGKVYDLYSKEVMSLAAASPAAWVRGCVAARDVRVVLLQSPTLAALHAVTLADGRDRLRLEEPLLPRRCAYRRPHFGDTLLQYAAQLLGETAHAAPAPHYTKYFLATVSELPVDVFPALVPYTRFELPLAAPALMHSLWPAATPAATPAVAPDATLDATLDTPALQHLQAISEAASALVQFVRDNPNYLAEELVFV